MSKKISIIAVVITLVIISLIISIYLPNKQKIEKNMEEKSTSYYLLKKDEKFGVINDKGNIIVQPKYTEVVIPNLHKAVFLCYNEDKEIVLNEKEEKILTQFEKIGILIRHNFDFGKNKIAKSVFELNKGSHHDHLVCINCGKVEEFYDEVIEKKQIEITDKYGFHL